MLNKEPSDRFYNLMPWRRIVVTESWALNFFKSLYSLFLVCLFCLFCIYSLPSCSKTTTGTQNIQDTRFEIVPPAHSGIDFVNRLRESPSQNVLSYEYFYNGAGLAIADFNQDDLPDIYFVSNLGANQLYLNQGELRFKDITSISQTAGKRGFYTGVTTVDINADGRMDIYLSKSGRFDNPDLRRNELYINQGLNEEGMPVFVEKAKDYGIDIASYSSQASFFDYDLDGDLDLFLLNHDINTYATDEIAAMQEADGGLSLDRLFRNDGNHFQDITANSGIVNNQLGFGLGVGVGDLNNDGWPDVYVSNDYSGKDQLYINQKNGKFADSIQQLTNQISFYAMGNDISDINNDGWLDIVNLDMVAEDNYGIKTSMSAMNPAEFARLVQLGEHHQYMFNSFLLNNGTTNANQGPHFSNIGQLLGISNTDWSWAPLLFDFDNDGLQDLFISNGIKRNIRNNDALIAIRAMNDGQSQSAQAEYIGQALKQFPYHRKPNYFYHNKGNLSFDNISRALGLDSIPTASNGAAYADLDLDGDLDLVINNVDQPAMIFRNNSDDANNYLQLKFIGPKANPLGFGTRVTIRYKDAKQTKELYTTRGYLSAVEPILHFGLGQEDLIDEIDIVWPGGQKQTLSDIRVNQRIEVNYEEASESIFDAPANLAKENSFKDLSPSFVQHRHQENSYDDFAKEILLPHKMSQFGPALAVADVNGDGLDDFFIGGAKDFAASLYLQQADGQMLASNQALWQNQRQFEDAVATFFDADQDQDLDLVVGTGGNEWPQEHDAYQLRFYENIGDGSFERNDDRLPIIRASVSVLEANDFDQDGDLDLFVGGRQVPGAYPNPSNSYLLRNEGPKDENRFIDVSPEIAPFLESFGMVTDAIWVDLNADGRADLVTVGEWMAPRVLLNLPNRFEDNSQAAQLSDQTGWWNTIIAEDFDQDGDLDLVAGNLGLNYKYKAPFKVYSTDFDDNGSQDIVLGYYSEGDLFPLRGRECSSQQMPFIKTKFPSYDAFAKAELKEVYTSEKLDQAVQYEAQNFASTYFENKGNAQFVASPLPILAQVSSINDIFVFDFNQDGLQDLLVAGNMYGSEVETPRNDASIGLVLIGDGQGGFQALSAGQTGLKIIGEVKKMQAFNWQGRQHNYILMARNNDAIKLIEYTGRPVPTN